ncbi:hypothetical protein AB0M95_04280 [Sphaerisporangium sp. NPDC051017]
MERYRRVARRRTAGINAIRRILRGGRHGLGDLASLLARRWTALLARLRR